jgi:arginine-tRNA-protein transferase
LFVVPDFDPVITERLKFINEEFFAESVEPSVYDRLLADGWRHFGEHFFRYSLGMYRQEVRRVMPLRVRLVDFRLSESQRRVLRKNKDLQVQITPAEITEETHELFQRHKMRFDHGVPESIYNFISQEPGSVPTDGRQITARASGGKLLAVSFFDVGATSVSAIYGCFDPEEKQRSLGIFTMLKVIEFAASNNKTFYYHGYAYQGPSFYDYKKRFSGTEVFDWQDRWKKLATEDTENTEPEPPA